MVVPIFWQVFAFFQICLSQLQDLIGINTLAMDTTESIRRILTANAWRLGHLDKQQIGITTFQLYRCL